jgi:endonuclease/exonuclease/phosphatase family metal-dependent hydrolase
MDRSRESNQLRLLSFNIRYSESRDGRNIWQNRRPLVAEILRTYRPDVVGFQEVLIDQLRDLGGMLPDYQWVGVGREDGGQRGEFAPLFFHHLKVVETGNFWLSDTPEIPSNTWGGQHRICTWVRFGGLQPFAVFNTHLESDVAEARARSVPLLSNKVGEVAGELPVLLIGDFNFKPNSQEHKQLSREFRDSFREPRGSRNRA